MYGWLMQMAKKSNTLILSNVLAKAQQNNAVSWHMVQQVNTLAGAEIIL
jgi:hypothetical protein